MSSRSPRILMCKRRFLCCHGVAVCFSVLQRVAVCGSVLQWRYMFSFSPFTVRSQENVDIFTLSWCCSVLQCVAVCCSVL